MASHERTYTAEPGLRRFNAQERFTVMRMETEAAPSLDLSASRELRDAVGVYDPRRRVASRGERSRGRLLDGQIVRRQRERSERLRRESQAEED
jgi:hypothetical protein